LLAICDFVGSDKSLQFATGLLARGGKVVGAELLGGNFPSPPPSDRKGAVTRYKRPDSHGRSGAADRRAQELWQICHMSYK
jgi:hypothetical protein